MKNNVTKMYTNKTFKEYTNENPMEVAFPLICFGGAALVSGMLMGIQEGPVVGVGFALVMIACGMFIMGVKAFYKHIQNEVRANKILSSATKVYLKNTMENAKEILSSKKSVKNLRNEKFNTLPVSEQQKVVTVLKEFDKSFDIKTLKITVEKIVDILKAYDATAKVNKITMQSPYTAEYVRG